MSHRLSRVRLTAIVAAIAASTTPAFAQLDPLFFMRGQAATSTTPNMAPNVVFLVDTSNRMQRDAATDLTNATTATSTSTYYDPFIYTRSGALYEGPLGVSDANTNAAGTGKYRRKYVNLAFTSGSGDKFTATTIQIKGDKESDYNRFGAPTRLSIARAAMYQAINENKNVARFGLVQMRQKSPTMPTTAGNSGPVAGSPGRTG